MDGDVAQEEGKGGGQSPEAGDTGKQPSNSSKEAEAESEAASEAASESEAALDLKELEGKMAIICQGGSGW